MLRASGVNYDIRKVDRYGIYDRFNFRVPLGERGDVYDRYMVRVLEMRESIKILEQALKEVPAGPIMDPKAKLRGFRPKPARPTAVLKRPRASWAFISSVTAGRTLSLSRAPTQPDQPDGSGGHGFGSKRRRCRTDLWQCGYCPW